MSHIIRPVSSLQRHLAAISPYSSIFKQPPPKSEETHAAVYLFRHGILEVSRHDYVGYIAPFLQKLHSLQKAGRPFVAGGLSFLSSYQSWITEAHVGMVSQEGFEQCSDLGRTFRARYKQWLIPPSCHRNPTLDVWTDSATRCRLSAVTFAEAFAGKTTSATAQPSDHLQQVNSKVQVLHSEQGTESCDNLCWHTAFTVDQTAGHDKFERLMQVTTRSAYERLKRDWIGPVPLQAKDIYSMQLLHYYDAVAQRPSPFNGCFQQDDWAGFEYLRDVKYHFSEGYGTKTPGFYAIPWVRAAITALRRPRSRRPDLPLQLAFTHREEVLYLCCLLGVNFKKGWEPSLEKVDEDRRWRVSHLAPYLGHVGMETYSSRDSQNLRVRLIVNGNVSPAFFGAVEQDSDGGYDLNWVDQWTETRFRAWQIFNSSRITFIR